MNRYKHTETGEIKSHREWQNKLETSFHADRPPPVLELYQPPAPQSYVPDLATVKQQAQAELVHIFEQKAEAIAGKYPWFERDTWQDQEAEALAYLADPSAPTPNLTGITQWRDITIDELAHRVIANAAAWRAVAPDLCGQRQAASDQINAATTVEQVQQIMESLRNPPDQSAAA
ncbi:hypothetical protein [Marinobacterium sp. BA1]|uniref:hypothetical protein n=1 Tax=Marinobacterium sp. BA1 TaxID=3138931 RepID=UPI0032E7CFD4